MGWLKNARLSPFRLTTLVGDQATELEGTKSALNLVLQSAGYVMKFVENGRQRQSRSSLSIKILKSIKRFRSLTFYPAYGVSAAWV